MSRNHSGVAIVIAMLATLALAACSPFNSSSSAAPAGSPSAQPSAPATTKPPKPTGTPKPPPKYSPERPVPQTVQKGVGPHGSIKATGSRSVALTFDDGPDPVNTPKMLDLLKKNKVKATFCLVGKQANRYPGLVARIVAEGHTLCNHSWYHRYDLGKQPVTAILKELRDTNAAILRGAPRAKIKYFRAPGGMFTSRLVSAAAKLGMKSIYWSLDTRDWDFKQFPRGAKMTKHIIDVVRTYARPGAIILSHDFYKPDTVAAYAVLLPWLRGRYTLIALPT